MNAAAARAKKPTGLVEWFRIDKGEIYRGRVDGLFNWVCPRQRS